MREIVIFCSRKANFSSYTSILWHILTKFRKFTRQQEELTSYGASVPALILLVPSEFTNRWLCQYLRIAAIIVLDGQNPAEVYDPIDWETKPRNHFSSSEMQSEELRSSIFNNWQIRFCKRKRAVLYLAASSEWNCMLPIQQLFSTISP